MLVIKEIVPIKILVPRFKRIATPMTRRNRTGSDQAVVEIHNTKRIMRMATARIRFISLSSVSANDRFCTAIPTKQP